MSTKKAPAPETTPTRDVIRHSGRGERAAAHRAWMEALQVGDRVLVVRGQHTHEATVERIATPGHGVGVLVVAGGQAFPSARPFGGMYGEHIRPVEAA